MLKYLALIALGSLIAITADAQDKPLDLTMPSPHVSPNPPKNTYCDNLVNSSVNSIDTSEAERCASVLMFERKDAESYKNAALLLYVANNDRQKQQDLLARKLDDNTKLLDSAMKMLQEDATLFNNILSTQRTAAVPTESAWRSFLGNFATNFARIQANQPRPVNCQSSSTVWNGGKQISTDTTCH